MSHLDEGTLHTYLDGELEPVDEAQLREHLATCAACRGHLDAERIVRSRAHEILRYADPPGIVTPDFSEVRARATRRPTAPPDRSRVRPLVLPWAASVVLALGVGWFAQSLLSGDGGAGAARVAIESDAPETTRAAEALPVTTEVGQAAGATPPVPEAAAAAAEPTPAAPESGAQTAQGAVTAPATIAPDEVTVTGAAAISAEPRARVMADATLQRAGADALPPAAAPPAASTLSFQKVDALALSDSWVVVDAAAAARELGTAPLVLSELPVMSYAVTSDEPGTVRVVQRLPEGELLEIYQRRAAEGTAGIDVTLRGAVPPDSLRRLEAELTQ